MNRFRIMKEAKQATELENEVMRRVAQLDDPSAITIQNLNLQVLVMKSDVKRYAKGKFFAKDFWGNAIDWNATIQGTQGFIDIYEKAIDEGLDKWLDRRFLKNEFDRVKERQDRQDDKYSWTYYNGQLKAIAGLQEGELYHSWTDPNMIIGTNPRFIEILEKRGLLYEVFDPNNVVKEPDDDDDYDDGF